MTQSSPGSAPDLSRIADLIDDIEVDANGMCRWSDVANAQTLIRMELRRAPAQAAPPEKPGLLESNPALFDILNNALGTMHYHRLMSALNWNGYKIVREGAEPQAAGIDREAVREAHEHVKACLARLKANEILAPPELYRAAHALHHALNDTPPQAANPLKGDFALKALGSRLADLLDADHWNNVEPFLLDIEQALRTPPQTAPTNKPAERWEVGKNGWDASDEITREDI